MSVEMNEDGDGFPIYRMNEIEEMLCAWDIAKYASISHKDAEPFFLKPRDVLFNRTNSQRFVGRTGLYLPFSEEKRVFASYLVRIIPDENTLLPEYLVTYLNSSRGISDVKRRARISINQSNVNPEEVKAVRIPLLGKELQLLIRGAFVGAHESQRAASVAIAKGGRALLDALGLGDWQPPELLTYTRRASDVFAAERLDAEYYQEPYFNLAKHLRSYDKGCVTLGEICPTLVNGVEIREYENEGIPYLRVGDVHNFTINLDKVMRVAHTAANKEIEKVRLQVGDVLVSRSGSLAVTAVVESEWVHSLISSHLILTRITNPDFDPYYIAAFLASMPGKMQIIQHGNGGVQPEINQPALKRILIPRLLKEHQQEVRDSILFARAVRQHAHALLDRAKRAVEIAIEDSETAALAYLEAQGVR